MVLFQADKEVFLSSKDVANIRLFSETITKNPIKVKFFRELFVFFVILHSEMGLFGCKNII